MGGSSSHSPLNEGKIDNNNKRQSNMISDELKEEVRKEIKKVLDSEGISANALAKRLGTNQAYMSHILNGKWTRLSEELWSRLAGKLQVSEGRLWRMAEIKNLKRVRNICKDAQHNQKMIALSYNVGHGKSAGLLDYTRHNKEVFFIRCKKIFNQKDFLKAIAEAMGYYPAGTATTVLNKLVKYIKSEYVSPLIILDELDKLRDPVLSLVKDLYDDTRDETHAWLGIVCCGAPRLQSQIEAGVDAGRQSYQEIYSRMGGEFISLKRITAQDVESICKANGVAHEEVIRDIVTMLGKGDLRKLRRLVEQEKIRQRGGVGNE